MDLSFLELALRQPDMKILDNECTIEHGLYEPRAARISSQVIYDKLQCLHKIRLEAIVQSELLPSWFIFSAHTVLKCLGSSVSSCTCYLVMVSPWLVFFRVSWKPLLSSSPLQHHLLASLEPTRNRQFNRLSFPSHSLIQIPSVSIHNTSIFCHVPPPVNESFDKFSWPNYKFPSQELQFGLTIWTHSPLDFPSRILHFSITFRSLFDHLSDYNFPFDSLSTFLFLLHLWVSGLHTIHLLPSTLNHLFY